MEMNCDRILQTHRIAVGGMSELRGIRLIWATIQGSFYMLHWIPVMIFSVYRLCIQRQKLYWHKTEHYGVRSYKLGIN